METTTAVHSTSAFETAAIASIYTVVATHVSAGATEAVAVTCRVDNNLRSATTINLVVLYPNVMPIEGTCCRCWRRSRIVVDVCGATPAESTSHQAADVSGDRTVSTGLVHRARWHMAMVRAYLSDCVRPGVSARGVG